MMAMKKDSRGNRTQRTLRKKMVGKKERYGSSGQNVCVLANDLFLGHSLPHRRTNRRPQLIISSSCRESSVKSFCRPPLDTKICRKTHIAIASLGLPELDEASSLVNVDPSLTQAQQQAQMDIQSSGQSRASYQRAQDRLYSVYKKKQPNQLQQSYVLCQSCGMKDNPSRRNRKILDTAQASDVLEEVRLLPLRHHSIRNDQHP